MRIAVLLSLLSLGYAATVATENRAGAESQTERRLNDDEHSGYGYGGYYGAGKMYGSGCGGKMYGGDCGPDFPPPGPGDYPPPGPGDYYPPGPGAFPYYGTSKYPLLMMYAFRGCSLISPWFAFLVEKRRLWRLRWLWLWWLRRRLWWIWRLRMGWILPSTHLPSFPCRKDVRRQDVRIWRMRSFTYTLSSGPCPASTGTRILSTGTRTRPIQIFESIRAFVEDIRKDGY